MPSSSYAINDAEVGHAVQLLTQDDEEHFLRWTDVCDSVFIRDSSNNTLLHWSASLGNLSLTRHLTDLGLDVRARNLHGSTPLHCAAASCRNPGAILEFLISHGASTTEANDVGDTMQSLLERRQLQDLGDLFTLLQTTMDECPKLFASTGRDVEGLTFDVGADLGTAKVLAKMSGSTVRFEKQDVGAMMGSGSGVEELQQHGLRRRSGPMTSSSMQKQQGMESAGSSNMYSPRTCDSSSLNPDPSPSTQVSFDASWIAERERKVLSMEEDADRLRTENEYWVEFSAIAGAAHDAGTLFSCPRRVHAVLGERYGEGGKRFLLIQWEDDDGNPMEDEETWELIPDVSYSPVVGEYIARFEGSYSTMDNVAMTYTTGTTSAQQRVLDSREREELERELDLLPRRVCSISSQSLTTSTPRLMRRGRSNQEFEELCHEEEEAPAQATQDDVVAHEHEPLGNMMRAQIGSRETDDEVCDWLNLQDVKPDWLVAGESVRSDQDDLRAARRFISSMNNSGRVGKWVRVMEEDASPPEAIPSLPVSRSGNDVPVQLPSSSQPLQMRLSSQTTASPIRRHAPPVNVPTGILSTPRLCSLEVQSQQAQQAQQAAGQGSSDSSSQDAGPTPLAASAAQAADQPPPPAKSTFLRPSSVARQPNSAARQRVEQQLRSIRSHAHSPPPDIERRDANIRFAEATRFEYEKFLYRSALSILQQRQDVVDGLDL